MADSSPATPSSHRRRLVLDVIALAVMMFAFSSFMGMAQTLVPLLATELGLQESTIGVIQAIPGLSAVLGAPLAHLANTRWRRATLKAMFVIAAVASLLYSQAGSALDLVIPQLLFGIAMPGFIANNLVSAFRLASGRQQYRIQGMVTMGQGLGLFVGPVLGGYLSGFSYSIGFNSGLICALIGFAAAMALSPSRAIEETQGLLSDLVRTYWRLAYVLTRRPVVMLGMSYNSLTGVQEQVLGGSFFLVYASLSGLSPFQASALISVRSLIQSLMRFGFTPISRWIHPVTLLALSTVLAALVLGAMPFSSSLLGLGLITVILGLALGFVRPSVNILGGASAAPEEQAHAIMSLLISGIVTRMVVAPIAGLAISTFGYRISYPALALLWVVLGLFTLRVGLNLLRQPQA